MVVMAANNSFKPSPHQSGARVRAFGYISALGFCSSFHSGRQRSASESELSRRGPVGGERGRAPRFIQTEIHGAEPPKAMTSFAVESLPYVSGGSDRRNGRTSGGLPTA
jgi:hypothetical protein